MKNLVSYLKSILNPQPSQSFRDSVNAIIKDYASQLDSLLAENVRQYNEKLHLLLSQFTAHLDRIERNYNDKLEVIKNGYEMQIKYLTNSISASVKIQMKRDKFAYDESIRLLKKDFESKLDLIKTSESKEPFASYPMKSETIKLNYSNPNFNIERIKVDLSRKLAQYIVEKNLIDGNYDVNNNQVIFNFNLKQIEI